MTLREIQRVLRPDGLFVAVEPWNTTFLRMVHACCGSSALRRWDKLDALATMIDRERPSVQAMAQPRRGDSSPAACALPSREGAHGLGQADLCRSSAPVSDQDQLTFQVLVLMVVRADIVEHERRSQVVGDIVDSEIPTVRINDQRT